MIVIPILYFIFKCYSSFPFFVFSSLFHLYFIWVLFAFLSLLNLYCSCIHLYFNVYLSGLTTILSGFHSRLFLFVCIHVCPRCMASVFIVIMFVCALPFCWFVFYLHQPDISFTCIAFVLLCSTVCNAYWLCYIWIVLWSNLCPIGNPKSRYRSTSERSWTDYSASHPYNSLTTHFKIKIKNRL